MKSCFKYPMLSVVGASFVLAGGDLLAQDAPSSAAQGAQNTSASTQSPLVEKVRVATERYRDVNLAIEDGWVQATPCVSGPNEGAMGVHFVLPERVGDAVLDPEAPEMLIYEPLAGGRYRLVGVEFIVLADAWNTAHAEAQPALAGHLLNFVGTPNRYRLPAFYEMHVWAWESNPNGSFADWNTRVSCDLQPTG